jgi:hypothetical protein
LHGTGLLDTGRGKRDFTAAMQLDLAQIGSRRLDGLGMLAAGLRRNQPLPDWYLQDLS